MALPFLWLYIALVLCVKTRLMKHTTDNYNSSSTLPAVVLRPNLSPRLPLPPSPSPLPSSYYWSRVNGPPTSSSRRRRPMRRRNHRPTATVLQRRLPSGRRRVYQDDAVSQSSRIPVPSTSRDASPTRYNPPVSSSNPNYLQVGRGRRPVSAVRMNQVPYSSLSAQYQGYPVVIPKWQVWSRKHASSRWPHATNVPPRPLSFHRRFGSNSSHRRQNSSAYSRQRFQISSDPINYEDNHNVTFESYWTPRRRQSSSASRTQPRVRAHRSQI